MYLMRQSFGDDWFHTQDMVMFSSDVLARNLRRENLWNFDLPMATTGGGFKTFVYFHPDSLGK